MQNIPLNFPDVLIPGAPRCGTSALFYWLADHPLVCPSEPKETRNLMDWNRNLFFDKNDNFISDSLDIYNGNFRSSKKDRIKLEASTHYIYQKLPLQLIQKLNISTKALFLFRNPGNRIFSSFQYSKWSLNRIDKSYSFLNYTQDLLSNNQDNLNKLVNHQRTRHVLYNELEFSRYYTYLESWKSVIGEQNTMVIITEDLFKNSKNILENVLNFLNLNASFERPFQKRNETKLNRFKTSGSIFTFARFIPPRLKKMINKLLTHKVSKSTSDQSAINLINKNLFLEKEKYENSGIDTSFWIKN